MSTSNSNPQTFRRNTGLAAQRRDFWKQAFPSYDEATQWWYDLVLGFGGSQLEATAEARSFATKYGYRDGDHGKRTLRRLLEV